MAPLDSARGGGGRSRWSPAVLGYYARKLARRLIPPLESVADKTWEIAPAFAFDSPRAFFLPGQLERIRGSEFAPEPPRSEMLGRRVIHAATRGFLAKDAWLFDGALFKDGAYRWLTSQRNLLPRLRAGLEIERGAMFCTAMGNRYFGQWLIDDCATYFMAREEGVPVMTDQPVNPHTPAYEEWLGMEPVRLHCARFRELVFFDDFGYTEHKRRRFREMGARLRSRVDASPHPGVFILRGRSGATRMLRNEEEIAERLRDRRGFRIVDPASMDVPAIVAACAGARVVAGVEGSGLMHGVLILQEGGSILTLQPPNRFVAVYKHLADRNGQSFGFLVGIPEGEGFRIDPDEVERTLDLLPSR